MPLHLLPSLLLYILMVGYTPGPANLYALSCSLKYGRKSALRMWYGELCGFLIAVTLVSIATHLVGTVMGEYVEWLKYPSFAAVCTINSIKVVKYQQISAK